MLIKFFKRNSILLFFAALCLLTLALVLVEIDRQYYQRAKREIIGLSIRSGKFSNLQREEMEQLNQLALDDLKHNLPENARRSPEIRQRLLEKINQILDGPSIIWRIAIEPERASTQSKTRTRQEVDIIIDQERPEKIRRLNDFTNSLFLRNFSGNAALPIQDAGYNALGYLYVYYTTPKGDLEIQELTTQYRWISAFIAAILAILAGAVARSLLVPLVRVTNSLEESTPARTVFIPHPHTRMELLYNRMALDAVIARLQGQLRDEIARHPQMTGWEVVTFVCQAFREQIHLPLVACLEMVAEGPGRIRATGLHILVGREPWSLPREEMAETLNRLMPRDGRTREPFVLPELEPPLEGALELTLDPERTGIRYLFALAVDSRTGDSAYVSLQHMLDRLTDLVDAGLQTLSLRNQLLVQERGRANISLSRNLGHDLTNIIATSKLELMALDRLLGDGQVPEDSRRRMILSESLHGLLRSVKFMQETVNLYRAYAFLQHPVLEVTDGNELVSETMELFDMSVSAKVTLLRELTLDAPRCVVDPRLIKLALFNLFSNALEAIRKIDPDRVSRGFIRVVTRRTTEGGLCIAVEDSGTGILNPSGQPAEAHEIEKIFELGYTSARVGGSQGEGLGLNWVRTIIHDLHGGQIFAENIAGGGARFIIILPPLEGAPRASAEKSPLEV